MGGYNGDSSGKENFDLLLWLTWIGANIDSKVLQRRRFLKDFFKDKGVAGLPQRLLVATAP